MGLRKVLKWFQCITWDRWIGNFRYRSQLVTEILQFIWDDLVGIRKFFILYDTFICWIYWPEPKAKDQWSSSVIFIIVVISLKKRGQHAIRKCHRKILQIYWVMLVVGQKVKLWCYFHCTWRNYENIQQLRVISKSHSQQRSCS